MIHEVGVAPEGLDYGRWPKGIDMWTLRTLSILKGLRPDRPPGLIRPSSPEMVAGVLRMASETGACLVVRGGGSNVVGSASPPGCCVVLDMGGLDRIRGLREDLYVVEAEAGVRIGDLEAWLRARGYTIYYRPQSMELATVGGSISTLGAGAYNPGLGNIEDLVVYLDVAMPDGSVYRLGSPGNPRGLLGPGVKWVFLGAEGSMGVIVAAGLLVRKAREHRLRASYVFPGTLRALEAAKRLSQGHMPEVLRLIDRDEAGILYGVERPILIAVYESDDPELLGALESYLDRVARGLGGSRDDEHAAAWERERLGYMERIRDLYRAGLWYDTIDVGAVWGSMASINSGVKERLRRLGGVRYVMSHMSHFYYRGGSIYFTIITDQDESVLAAAWEEALRTALSLGGSVTHHHGIGRQKLGHALRELGDSMRLICRVKGALDPGHVIYSPLTEGCRRLG